MNALKLVLLLAVLVVPAGSFYHGVNEKPRRNDAVPAPGTPPIPPGGLPAIPPEFLFRPAPSQQPQTWQSLWTDHRLALARQAAALAENAKDQALPVFCTFRPRVLIWDAE